ncbi:MAG: UDP-N-acetylmuramoyl-L-alanine--D-glutamate ligase [bacterium]|nr:UDP-N-acetylmuramoyl-L-alanine--D-glutamate ligase [bacterium]
MELAQKNIVVVGLGITGVAVARFLKNRAAAVTATDMVSAAVLGSKVQDLKAMGISLDLGGHRTETFQNADLIVMSPGVSHTIEPVLQARERGIPVIGEIELASKFIRQPVVAVTGTNGKTTTTELVGDMLKRSGFKVLVGGNIGNPLIEYVDGKQEADVIVAEISSFQLDTIDTFRPHIGVLLNITVDHLDRYPDFAAYAASKIRLFENQESDDIAVLNGSDRLVCSLTENIKSQKLIYPNPKSGEEGAVLNHQHITIGSEKLGARDEKFQLPTSDFRLPLSLDLAGIKITGRHNLENACAAGLAALAVGARPEAIQDTLNQYRGSAHRLEFIASIDDIDFFNDSKATNVDAVLRAVDCFHKPVVLIMGGLDKGGNFKALREVVSRRVKKLIVMGQAADLIQKALADAVPAIVVKTMAEAADRAYRAGSAGDVVLLSPGCASFDMYDNYARRGNDFKDSVAKLQRKITA